MTSDSRKFPPTRISVAHQREKERDRKKEERERGERKREKERESKRREKEERG